MKNKFLPETDLARVALLPADEKRIQLRQVKLGIPPYTYKPTRDAIPAIFNARKSLLALPDSTPEDIVRFIQRECRNKPKSLAPNLALVKALIAFSQEKKFVAHEQEFMAVPFGLAGLKFKLWHNFYMIEDDKPVVCYVDPRLSKNLSRLGKLFTFSIMSHTLAVGDFSDVRFQIFQLPRNSGGERQVQIDQFDPAQLIGEDRINAAISETYKIWHEILDEREEEARRNPPPSGPGSLFG